MSRNIGHVQAKAEGRIAGFPYDTQLVSSEGVAFHVWLGDIPPNPTLLAKLERRARKQRDIVTFTYGPGEPTGFWANEDFGGTTL
jgi:hypothetical protein